MDMEWKICVCIHCDSLKGPNSTDMVTPKNWLQTISCALFWMHTLPSCAPSSVCTLCHVRLTLIHGHLPPCRVRLPFIHVHPPINSLHPPSAMCAPSPMVPAFPSTVRAPFLLWVPSFHLFAPLLPMRTLLWLIHALSSTVHAPYLPWAPPFPTKCTISSPLRAPSLPCLALLSCVHPPLIHARPPITNLHLPSAVWAFPSPIRAPYICFHF
jgi:hypothetical protein